MNCLDIIDDNELDEKVALFRCLRKYLPRAKMKNIYDEDDIFQEFEPVDLYLRSRQFEIFVTIQNSVYQIEICKGYGRSQKFSDTNLALVIDWIVKKCKGTNKLSNETITIRDQNPSANQPKDC